MEATRDDKLHSLLFEEGRELVNIKFFPGTDRGISPARLKDAAHKAIASAMSGDLVDTPPTCGRTAVTLEDFLASR